MRIDDSENEFVFSKDGSKRKSFLLFPHQLTGSLKVALQNISPKLKMKIPPPYLMCPRLNLKDSKMGNTSQLAFDFIIVYIDRPIGATIHAKTKPNAAISGNHPSEFCLEYRFHFIIVVGMGC